MRQKIIRQRIWQGHGFRHKPQKFLNDSQSFQNPVFSTKVAIAGLTAGITALQVCILYQQNQIINNQSKIIDNQLSIAEAELLKEGMNLMSEYKECKVLGKKGSFKNGKESEKAIDCSLIRNKLALFSAQVEESKRLQDFGKKVTEQLKMLK